MTEKHDVTGLLKIGELAKATGISVSTVKYYVKEGLVDIAKKTGRNMAYYHPDSVKRVLLIKSLQKQKYYPLSVIKRLLQSGEPGFPEIELYDAIHKVDRTAAFRTLTLSAATRETGLSRSQIEAMEAAGLISSVLWENKRAYRESDCRIMQLAKRRENAGIPFSQTLKSFAVYQRSLGEAVIADIDAIISEAIVPESPSTGEIVHMIRISDETLDEFVSLKRYELNREFGSRHIGDVERFSAQLKAYLAAVHNALALAGETALRTMCEFVLKGGCCTGEGDIAAALRMYGNIIFLSGGGLAESIAACNKANHFFNSLRPGTTASLDTLLLQALLLGWLRFAPDVLHCGGRFEAAAADLGKIARGSGESAQSFISRVLDALKGDTV